MAVSRWWWPGKRQKIMEEGHKEKRIRTWSSGGVIQLFRTERGPNMPQLWVCSLVKAHTRINQSMHK